MTSYYQRNRERILSLAREKYRRNTEVIKARHKKWREEHREERNLSVKKHHDKFPGGVNHNERWSQGDDIILLSHQGLTRELVPILHRSLVALGRRRSKLKNGLCETWGIPERLLA